MVANSFCIFCTFCQKSKNSLEGQRVSKFTEFYVDFNLKEHRRKNALKKDNPTKFFPKKSRVPRKDGFLSNFLSGTLLLNIPSDLQNSGSKRVERDLKGQSHEIFLIFVWDTFS